MNALLAVARGRWREGESRAVYERLTNAQTPAPDTRPPTRQSIEVIEECDQQLYEKLVLQAQLRRRAAPTLRPQTTKQATMPPLPASCLLVGSPTWNYVTPLSPSIAQRLGHLGFVFVTSVLQRPRERVGPLALT